jgi:hypothetical protein
MWGELVADTGPLPKSIDEAIELKKKQMEELRSKAAGNTGATLTSADLVYATAYSVVDRSARLRMEGKDPEGEFKGAYKVMRAGV